MNCNNKKFKKYPYIAPDFKNYSDYIYPLNKLFYSKLKDYSKPCLSQAYNINNIFFECLLDNTNVINLLVQNSRGLHKSKFMRNLALHIKKHSSENVEFDINSFCFGNDELYNNIIKYLDTNKKIPNKIKIFIIDEDDSIYGEGSITAIRKLQQIIDKIRIMKIIILKIKPAENIFFISDIEYAFNIKPIAYNGKLFYCLIKEFNELEYNRNIIVKDYDIYNSKLYQDYFNLKEKNFRLTQKGLKQEFNYLPYLFIIERKFKIFTNMNYKIIKNNIVHDFISVNTFKTYCKVCQINEIDSTIISLYEMYKLTLSNKQFLNKFKSYCTSFNYKLDIQSNKKYKQKELNERENKE